MSHAEKLPAPVARRRSLRRRTAVVAGLVALTFAAAWAAMEWRWRQPGPIDSSGGRYFFRRVEIAGPAFRQSDPRWAHDMMGPGPDTLAQAGCAVTSAAMVLAACGIDTDPKRLNAFLATSGGFTERCWLKWEVAADLDPSRVRFAYEDLPSYHLIDSNLARGNPVIVRLRQPDQTTHFVVICGKDGFDYLVRDPGDPEPVLARPLRETHRTIEALRFYEPLR